MTRVGWSLQLRVGVPGGAGVSSSKACVVREQGLCLEVTPAAASPGNAAAHAHARQQQSGGDHEALALAAASPLPENARPDSPSEQKQIPGAKLQAPSAPVQAWPLGKAPARLREAGRTEQGMIARGRGRGRGRGRTNRRQAQLAHLLQLLRMAPAEPAGPCRNAASVDGAGRMEGWLALRTRIAAAPDTHRAAAWRAVQQAIVQEGVAVLAAALAEPAAPAPGVEARLRLCLRRRPRCPYVEHLATAPAFLHGSHYLSYTSPQIVHLWQTCGKGFAWRSTAPR